MSIAGQEQSMNTEAPLLNTDTQIIKQETKYTFTDRQRSTTKCGPWTLLICGTVLTFLSIAFLIWTPFRTLMNERLRMQPGLPPYEWWKNPPDKVLLRVYIFNITNSEEFLNGTHSKLRLQEIGPIVFREKLIHKNVTFNENDTLSYVAKRTAVYLPELNDVDLNATLIVPNLPVLGLASYFWDSSFVTKIGFNILLRNLESKPVVNTTIYNYLWNFSDPILDVAQTLAPTLVPVKNMGILSRMYDNFEHLLTVKIGTKQGHESFFLIDKFDGSEYIPHYHDDDYSNCDDKLINSTEGVAYPQFLTKNTTIAYWRKTICKVVNLYFEDEVYTYGVNAYRFVLHNDTFDRNTHTYDCYVGDPPLPNGVADVSKCFYNFPMATSFPHFLYAAEVTKSYVVGLEPSVEKHGSFVHIEPVTGVPIESRARLQSNLIIRELSGFTEMVEKFSDIILPMFWAEYNQEGLPFYIAALMFFTVNVLPYLQVVMIITSLCIGLMCSVTSAYKFAQRKRGRLLQSKALKLKREICCTC